MLTTCVVCNITNKGMINIFTHPNNLDVMLNFVCGHNVTQEDYLCISCYDELKICFNFKQKCQQSRFYRPNISDQESIELKNVADLDEFHTVDYPTSSDNRTELEIQIESTETIITTKIQENDELKRNMDEYFIDVNGNDQKEQIDKHLEDTNATVDSSVDDPYIIETIESDENIHSDERMLEGSGHEEETTPITCELCNKTFTRNGNYRRHMKQLHLLGEIARRIPRDRHRRGPVPKYHEDDIFKNLGETQCEFCFMIVETLDDLQNHEAEHKNEEKPYRCNRPDCLGRFKDRYSVRNHLRIHTEIKRYKCRFCDQRFHQRGNAKAHERCHTGEKPYLCPHCGKAFAENGNLKSHIRFHTGERPYACSHCSKKFRTHYSHKIHVRSHTLEKPFPCTDCGKSFNCSGKLRIHKRIHTGHRPYKCQLCEASFMDSSRLKRHSKTHLD